MRIKHAWNMQVNRTITRQAIWFFSLATSITHGSAGCFVSTIFFCVHKAYSSQCLQRASTVQLLCTRLHNFPNEEYDVCLLVYAWKCNKNIIFHFYSKIQHVFSDHTTNSTLSSKTYWIQPQCKYVDEYATHLPSPKKMSTTPTRVNSDSLSIVHSTFQTAFNLELVSALRQRAWVYNV